MIRDENNVKQYICIFRKHTTAKKKKTSKVNFIKSSSSKMSVLPFPPTSKKNNQVSDSPSTLWVSLVLLTFCLNFPVLRAIHSSCSPLTLSGHWASLLGWLHYYSPRGLSHNIIKIIVSGDRKTQTDSFQGGKLKFCSEGLKVLYLEI